VNQLNDDDVVIVSAMRTPMGGFQGAFSSLSAAELGAVAIQAAIESADVSVDSIDEVLMGNVLSAGVGQAPARQAALGAGLPLESACTTVSKVCGSGMKALMLAHDQIKAGSSKFVVAGGMESMTNAPYFIEKARSGIRLGHAEIKDHMFYDGLEDAYTGKAMGVFAQEVADAKGVRREAMDEYALSSLQRAQTAIDQGYFTNEIAPVTVRSRKGEIVVSDDEQPGNALPEKIPNLKPAFSKTGTVTAANSSSISDGAAALILTTAAHASDLSLKPLARVVGHTTHAQAPSEFCLAPIDSIDKLLSKVAWSIDDIDLFEINEAFAMVAMLAMQELDLDHAKVNIHGGACALGHPIGASGARIIVTLIHALVNYRLYKRRMKIAIAGAGIGGLSAALCLIQSGHQVELFEKVSSFDDVGAGIQCGANAMHVFDYLGLSSQLDAIAVSCIRWSWVMHILENTAHLICIFIVRICTQFFCVSSSP